MLFYLNFFRHTLLTRSPLVHSLSHMVNSIRVGKNNKAIDQPPLHRFTNYKTNKG